MWIGVYKLVHTSQVVGWVYSEFTSLHCLVAGVQHYCPERIRNIILQRWIWSVFKCVHVFRGRFYCLRLKKYIPVLIYYQVVLYHSSVHKYLQMKLTRLYREWPKLSAVLAILSAIQLKVNYFIVYFRSVFVVFGNRY